MLAGGEVSEDEDENEVSNPAKRSPKDKDPVVKSEPNVEANTVELVVEVADANVEPDDQTGSHEDITAN